jgi:hypothetical protein
MTDSDIVQRGKLFVVNYLKDRKFEVDDQDTAPHNPERIRTSEGCPFLLHTRSRPIQGGACPADVPYAESRAKLLILVRTVRAPEKLAEMSPEERHDLFHDAKLEDRMAYEAQVVVAEDGSITGHPVFNWIQS